MILVDELINEFKLSLNNVAREDNFSLTTPDIITLVITTILIILLMTLLSLVLLLKFIIRIFISMII